MSPQKGYLRTIVLFRNMFHDTRDMRVARKYLKRKKERERESEKERRRAEKT